ncbi:MAG: VCBS repeat-containing protein, partial [Oscillospiraceae bacterium]|nr:VCBS repeat-containing protein [Oscillospiraceae bacterium]
MSKLARKVLSLYLVAALALPMLMGAMPVAAAGESSPMEMTPTAAGESIPEAELFARLGLSTASPAGSAGRAEMNPYGNKSVQIMTVNELALGVGNSMSIYGDGFIEGGNLSAKSVNPSGAWRNLTHVASMEGNFGGPNRMNSQSARKDALAVLGAYRLGNEYVFQVWAEGLAGAVGSVQLNIPGHAGNDIRIPASHFPDKQLQQNLHIATGDLNGDGFDEIIAILPMNNGASLGLYVWSVNNTSSETAFLSAANWTMEVTEIPGGFKLADWNTASLAVGDLNRDGCEDIAYVVSEVYVTKTRYDRHIETSRKYLERIYYGEDDFSLQSAKYERFAGDSYWAGWEDDISVMFPWEPGVAIADADPSGKAPNVLLLGYAIVNQASYVWDPQLTNVR